MTEIRIWRSLKEGEACQESREAGGPAVALQIQVMTTVTETMMMITEKILITRSLGARLLAGGPSGPLKVRPAMFDYF